MVCPCLLDEGLPHPSPLPLSRDRTSCGARSPVAARNETILTTKIDTESCTCGYCAFKHTSTASADYAALAHEMASMSVLCCCWFFFTSSASYRADARCAVVCNLSVACTSAPPVFAWARGMHACTRSGRRLMSCRCSDPSVGAVCFIAYKQLQPWGPTTSISHSTFHGG